MVNSYETSESESLLQATVSLWSWAADEVETGCEDARTEENGRAKDYVLLTLGMNVSEELLTTTYGVRPRAIW